MSPSRNVLKWFKIRGVLMTFRWSCGGLRWFLRVLGVLIIITNNFCFHIFSQKYLYLVVLSYFLLSLKYVVMGGDGGGGGDFFSNIVVFSQYQNFKQITYLAS